MRDYLSVGTTDIDEILALVEKHIREEYKKANDPRQHGHSTRAILVEIKPMKVGPPVMNLCEE